MAIDLMKDEQVAYEGKLHWSVLGFPVILMVLGAMIIASSGNWILFIAGSAWSFLKLQDRKSAKLLVTNKRVVLNTGWLRNSNTDIPLSKIETVKADIGSFGIGTLTIVGSGGTTAIIKNLTGPNAFKNAIQEQI